MSNILGFATARRTSRGELLATWLAGGTIKLYDGTRPTSADDAISGPTLLVTFAIPNPAGTVISGVLTGASIAAAQIAESGTPDFARVADSSGVTIFDADVGASGSGSVIELDSLTLSAGGYCTVTSLALTER